MRTLSTKQPAPIRRVLLSSMAAIFVLAAANVTATETAPQSVAAPQPITAPEPTYIIIGERLMVCNPFPECRDVGENDDEDDQG